MDVPQDLIWQPGADNVREAALTALGRRLGTDSYDALYRLSIEQPERYWRTVMDALPFDWLEPFERFCDLGDGAAFPSWFAGGRLNWVNNVLRWAAPAATPEGLALVCEMEDGSTEETTYATLAGDVLALAGGLRGHGVRPGDRVGLMMPMGRPCVVSFLAIAALGALCVPLFTGYGAEPVAARLSLAGAGYLIASAGFTRRGRPVSLLDVLAQVQARLPGLRLIVDASADQVPHGASAWAGLSAGTAIDRPVAMRPDDPFMIVFTSGTTGLPKGTVHTHAGFPLKILHDSAFHFELRPGDRWLWPSDMGWIVGPLTTIGALGRGATLVCYDGAPDFPSADRLASVIDRHRVTHFGASPTLIRSLAATPGSVVPHASSLRLLMVAGEVISPEHFSWFFGQFGRHELPVINYTGGTEASGAILASVPVRPIKAGGFNSASPGVAAFAADAQGRRVVGEVGELSIAEPFIGMTRSFWNDDARYLEAYWTAVPGQWTHGDLVLEDADGHFFVLGRSDDTLKIAGKRVGPAEIEAIVRAMPGVAEAAAIGLPDAVKGEQLVICLAAAPGPAHAMPGELEVADRIQAALGKPFRPARVLWVPGLPRTRNGKVMRRVVRRLLCGQEPGDLSALENPGCIGALKALAIGRAG